MKIFTRNQKELIADYMMSLLYNKTYLYDEEVVLKGEELLINNQISKLFEFNIGEEGILNLNKNQQNVIGDYISEMYEEESNHDLDSYEREYWYLKDNQLLHELFKVFVFKADTSHFSELQKRIVARYIYFRDGESGVVNYSDELIWEEYNYLKDTNNLHLLFEWHNPYILRQEFYKDEFDLVKDYMSEYLDSIGCCTFQILVNEYESLRYKSSVCKLFEYNIR
ncbi:hypothetical protein MHM83_07785 [Tenacibaculum sp. Mcav3-52]|uniref:hypothetical protein n=1 Tax=Tenacibaculum sp. Mcav3-52 TaxID=2917762 RepID=UPI001EF36C54|nr:hypothetical protein [Tenacibaculum sp. Mcav3-52]MCG7501769.1 hypothetical protein [Tenacibaculum sp. Mcav3-52]